MKTVLIRIELDEYNDQYGIRHECYNIRERVDVRHNGQHHEYQYYAETIRNPIYDSVDGRTWRCMVPTDFGCPATWIRVQDGEQVTDEIWLKVQTNASGQVRYYGRKPVIDMNEEVRPC